MGSIPSKRVRTSGRRGRYPHVTSGEEPEEGPLEVGGVSNVLLRLTDAELCRVTTFYQSRLEEVMTSSTQDLITTLSEAPAFKEELKVRGLRPWDEIVKKRLLIGQKRVRLDGLLKVAMEAGGSNVRELWKALGQVSVRNPALQDILQEVQARGPGLLFYITWNSLSEKLPNYMEVIQQASLRHRRDVLHQLELLWAAGSHDPWPSPRPEDYPDLLAISQPTEPSFSPGMGEGSENVRVRPLDPRLHLFPPFSSPGSPGCLTLLTGTPGIGKTACLRNLVSEWASSPSVYPELHFIFYIEFLAPGPELSLTAMVLKLYPGLAPLLTTLYSCPQALAFVFDGLERLDASPLPPERPEAVPEVTPEHSMPAWQILFWLAHGHLLPGCQVLLSARPHTAEPFLLLRPRLWAEVRGLRPEAWQAHLLRSFSQEPEAGQRLLARLLVSPLLKSLCSNPAYYWLASHCLAPRANGQGKEEECEEMPATTTELLACYLRWALSQEGRPLLPAQGLRSLLCRISVVALRCLADGGRPFQPAEWALQPAELPPGLAHPAATSNGAYSFRQPPVAEFLAALAQFLGPHSWEAQRETREATVRDGRYAGFLYYTAGLSRKAATQLLLPLLGPLSRRSVHGALRWLDRLSQDGAGWVTEGGQRGLLELARCLHEARRRRLALRAVTGLSGKRLERSGELPKARMDAQDCAALAYLKGLSGSTDVYDFSGCWLGAVGLHMLMPTLLHCKKLGLTCNNLGDEGMRILAILLRDPECQITHLDLTQNELTPSCVPDLASGIFSLRGLSLSENYLGDDAVQELCEALSGPSCRLEVLQLTRNRLTSAIVPVLCKLLSVCDRLHWLSLDENSVGDEGVKDLSASLSTSRLRMLGLSSNGLTDASVPELVNALGVQRSIRHLKLSNNLITDTSLPHISNLVKTCHRLQKLRVMNNLFTENGLQFLSSLTQDQKLLNLVIH
ncbi:NACHT, LRR and PYD domains-containing protein 14-like isoform X2 [Mobula hypostoma]|uniref:NACHT, LRR and PYD domains-containing protein 14-like isoform X2 n=1 Tax=Mobula hypostoma TaxID=723540 RepID=UPI002FC30EBB